MKKLSKRLEGLREKGFIEDYDAIQILKEIEVEQEEEISSEKSKIGDCLIGA